MRKEDNDIPFSVIKFFKIFEKEINNFNKFPVSEDNLVINQDAFSRLGGEVDFEHEIFASLVCDLKKKDTDLRFGFDFTAHGFWLNIEYFYPFWFDYSSFFESEKEAARQIAFCLKQLSSGQLSVLLTKRFDIPCASELILFDKNRKTPKVITTDTYYSMFWSKKNEYDYSIDILKNSYTNIYLESPNNYFLYGALGERNLDRGRKLTDNFFDKPLTKKLFKENSQNLDFQAMGASEGDNPEKFLYKQWELWSVFLLSIFVYIILQRNDLMPRFFVDHFILYALLGFLLSSFVTGALLSHKEELKFRKSRNIYIRIDELIHRYSLIRLLLLISVLVSSISGIILPIFVVKGDSKAVSLINMAASQNTWMFIVPIIFLVSLLLILRNFIALASFTALIAIGLIMYINFYICDPNVETPEPYAMISIVSMLVSVVLSVFCLYRIKKSPKIRRV